ncbi:D-sedoheptulose 7-phosphate isomerase [Desulfonatronospira sp. MSAO_Bac3]|uniref:D-sedoheptulose 7-phosphate isomerase n=1 Tax=Desulfonatronospira sp. MSAO_Bac3 TaxID=2293857 RepID=UPI000FEFE8D4|nr:D-sedoheptulose 7-phosphate isomerase [Desulfonatronospira sp. MSAO_Bac3]RQD76252.1 MAG: SIS domain-containing protein [Desulfonatronospira sp. MSAO_Bac3]
MQDKSLDIIHAHARDGSRARDAFFEKNALELAAISRTIAASMVAGGKVLFCGNGGSAADAQHLAAEFVNRFLLERPPLPAIALTTDTSILTAISNDYHFHEVFVKQVKALGRSGDILVGISTSGGSDNINKALHQALELDMVTVGLTGKKGREPMQACCSHLLVVDEESTPIIQEVHIAAGHIICMLVDHYLFETPHEL